MSDNDLVFLVQMSGGSTAGRDKSVINAHVSKQTHSRRRKERILQAQRTQDLASAQGQVPDGLRDSFSSEDTNPHDALGHLLPNCHYIAGCDFPLTSAFPPGFLRRCNLLEGLDGKAEDYLRFGRKVLEPAIHGVGYRGWVGLESPREKYVGPDLLTAGTLIDGKLHLHRADSFRVIVFAVLAYCASGFAVVHQAQYAHNDALNYIIICMKNLREYLDNLNHNINDISEDLVYRLFRAEVIANNHSSSSAHGELLRKIFEHRAHSSTLRLDVLSNTLYQDNHRALGSWSRPIFDQEWVRQQYQHEWRLASAMFELNEKEASCLSGCVEDRLLRSHLLAVQELLAQTQILTKREQRAATWNFFWFATQSEWLQMCLMNFYLDRTEQNADEKEEFNATSPISLSLCLSLATLYVLRHAKNDVHIQGQPLFLGCKNIYLRLDARLSALARGMSRGDSEQNCEAIIFLLFVTAVAEHHHLSFTGAPNAAYAWRRRLGQYLVANNIVSWERISTTLASFPYNEEEFPTPYTSWIEELVSEAIAG